MGVFIGNDRQPLNASQYVLVAASQTTKQISRAGTPNGSGGTPGDYLERVVVSPASSVAGAVSILDGTTVIVAIPALVSGANAAFAPYAVDVGCQCQSTLGFIVTTGSAVSVLVVGRFGA